MIVVLIIGILMAIAVPNFIKARETSRRNSCIANLKQIDGAKATWALELKKATTDTMDDPDLFGATLYIRDVAHIRDGFAPQTNIVRQDGNRGALMSIYKIGNASTLQIVDGIKKIVVQAAQTLDYPAIQTVAIFAGALMVLSNLVTDITYAIVDPRIRLS